MWYRRRARRQLANSVPVTAADKPARAEDVLNRPDPNEKHTSILSAKALQEQQFPVRVYAGNSNTTINLDPEAQLAAASVPAPVLPSNPTPTRTSVQSNPFEDNHSIQTTSTGTRSNVIPIALVAPGSVSSRSDPNSTHSTHRTSGSGPIRPSRDPELNLNLDHVNVSNDNIRAGSPYSNGSSGSANIRHSYMTTGSYASDLLSEAPVIVTPTRGTVKQVLGVVKAEVIRTPGSAATTSDGTPTSGDALRPGYVSTRPSMRSPLAASSFGPADILRESADEQEKGQEVIVRANPFGDENSPYIHGSTTTSPAPSTSTFGSKGSTPPQTQEDWTPEEPRLPWAGGSGKGRPESTSTHSGSIIAADISSATRVNVGLNQFAMTSLLPPSDGMDAPISAALSSPRTPMNVNRMTSAKLISPSNNLSAGVNGQMELQQRRAFEELESGRDRSSVVSSTSTRADSILESFPFVPPSPISDRPIRTPPRSPLAQQAFTNGFSSPTPASPVPAPVAEPREDSTKDAVGATRPPKKSGLPPPSMNRKVLGLSTASDSSTMSNGLGSFPFQIDNGSGADSGNDTNSPPSSFNGRQRASLDTLALTSDLSSYPLNFDRNLMDHYPGPYKQ